MSGSGVCYATNPPTPYTTNVIVSRTHMHARIDTHASIGEERVEFDPRSASPHRLCVLPSLTPRSLPPRLDSAPRSVCVSALVLDGPAERGLTRLDEPAQHVHRELHRHDVARVRETAGRTRRRVVGKTVHETRTHRSRARLGWSRLRHCCSIIHPSRFLFSRLANRRLLGALGGRHATSLLCHRRSSGAAIALTADSPLFFLSPLPTLCSPLVHSSPPDALYSADPSCTHALARIHSTPTRSTHSHSSMRTDPRG
jgi:hypothetical protein